MGKRHLVCWRYFSDWVLSRQKCNCC